MFSVFEMEVFELKGHGVQRKLRGQSLHWVVKILG